MTLLLRSADMRLAALFLLVAVAPADAEVDCRKTLEFERALEMDSSVEYENRPAEAARRAAKLLEPKHAESAVAKQAVLIHKLLRQRNFAAAAELADRRVCLRGAKGSPCVWFTKKQLAGCATDQRRIDWHEDTGESDPPARTCKDAFDQVFLKYQTYKTRPAYNCFPDRSDNNASSIITSDVETEIYVDFHARDTRNEGYGWNSLWLHFAKRKGKYRLVGLTSQYWGI